jgi:hypothetical protein
MRLARSALLVGANPVGLNGDRSDRRQHDHQPQELCSAHVLTPSPGFGNGATIRRFLTRVSAGQVDEHG